MKWIDIDKEIPSKDREFLAFGSGCIGSDFAICSTDEKGDYRSGHFSCEVKVKYWMYIPKLPGNAEGKCTGCIK